MYHAVKIAQSQKVSMRLISGGRVTYLCALAMPPQKRWSELAGYSDNMVGDTACACSHVYAGKQLYSQNLTQLLGRPLSFSRGMKTTKITTETNNMLVHDSVVMPPRLNKKHASKQSVFIQRNKF